ncbi:hypothetical protein VTN49DRAFT_1856 [Thermomyces lanuginosus]|uniref:uncharacterized protein n=1 Tax=Thermomyces lanuginosus TaxID=5541 RepID=UPI00374353BA
MSAICIPRWLRPPLFSVSMLITMAVVYFTYFDEAWNMSEGDRAIVRVNLPFKKPLLHHPKGAAYVRANASIISLVRNEELDGIIQSMRELERSFNSKFNYSWIFFNNEPFTDEFKRRTRKETNGECHYELIPPEHWNVPDWIDHNKLEESLHEMRAQGVQYADKLSYHQMCRWNSGFFYKHPALKGIKYYWRVEPDVKFYCDIDYDVFKFMEEYNKTYGFTINVYDDPKSVRSLWPVTQSFLDANPQYLSRDNSLLWLTDRKRRPGRYDEANGYSTCHFWSNFEIGDLDFWRSEAYEQFFEHLDRTGGFFYERWGDAPVHSVALGLFLDNEKIHWFRDIGYEHPPYINCPNLPSCQACQPNLFTHSWFNYEDCRPLWFHQVCESRRRKGLDDEGMCMIAHSLRKYHD